LYPEQTGVLDLKTHFRETLPEVSTLPQHFREHGYFTARVGKVFHQGVPDEIGSDGLDDAPSWHVAINPRGIDREVHDRIVSIVPEEQDKRKFGGTLSWLNLPGDDLEHTDGIGATRTIELLEAHHPGRTGQPFFIALGFYRPHTPFVAPSRYFDLHPLERMPLIDVPTGDRENKPIASLADRPFQADMTELQKRSAIQAYYAAVSFMDAQLGRVLDALERLGLMENTIVVFTSDHGYQLGRHGLWQKADLFEESQRVPLLLVAPDQREAGRVEPAIVELVDLYPTLLSMTGLPLPSHHLAGQDLTPVLSGRQPARGTALSQAWSGAHRTRPERRGLEIMGLSLRTDRYRYTEWDEGREGRELYDYLVDPNEWHNLGSSDTHNTVIEKLQQQLSQRDHRIPEHRP
jgi:arylsulfatase A-like enzyme